MAGFFVEGFTPAQMGVVLRSQKPVYVARRAIEPLFAFDFLPNKGKEVIVKRPNYWSRKGKALNNYKRQPTQLIGTANNKPLSTTDIKLNLVEVTGPNEDGTNNPSSLQVTKPDMLFARTKLYEAQSLQVFHDSIGSANLQDDWQSLEEISFLQELMKTTNKRNPGNAADNAVYASVSDAQFQCVRDLLRIGKQLGESSTSRFPDGFWHGLVSPTMFMHILADGDFRETQRSIIIGSSFQQQSPMANPLLSTLQMVKTPSGIVLAPQIEPIIYGDFKIWNCQMLGELAFDTTSTITGASNNNTAGNGRRAELGLFFGAGSVAEAQGGPGPNVLYNGTTDYGRIYNFIWQKYWDIKYCLDDSINSGTCVEARTYAS
jgi:hypothetical protein